MIHLSIVETPNRKDRKDLHFCLTSSSKNGNFINTFLSSLITVLYNKMYFSTRFFIDIKIEPSVKFNSEEQLKRSMICNPVNKNDNHWFITLVFNWAEIILSLYSLNQCKNAKIETIFH